MYFGYRIYLIRKEYVMLQELFPNTDNLYHDADIIHELVHLLPIYEYHPVLFTEIVTDLDTFFNTQQVADCGRKVEKMRASRAFIIEKLLSLQLNIPQDLYPLLFGSVTNMQIYLRRHVETHYELCMDQIDADPFSSRSMPPRYTTQRPNFGYNQPFNS